jgi:hypothetical protein
MIRVPLLLLVWFLRQAWNVLNRIGWPTSDPPVSISPVLGLQAHATMSSFCFECIWGTEYRSSRLQDKCFTNGATPNAGYILMSVNNLHPPQTLSPYRPLPHTSVCLCPDCTRREGHLASPPFKTFCCFSERTDSKWRGGGTLRFLINCF